MIIDAAHATFARGEKVMVVGETGTGKSVLTRAILGFWPWGSGAVSRPDDEHITIAHAAPWLPEGTLAAAIACPAPAGTWSHRDIGEALSACGAPHLATRLDDRARWMHGLSAGEKQRCAVARLILQKPAVVILEDALSACDAPAQAELTRLIFERCRSSIVIDVSNRPAPAHLYDRIFTLTRSGSAASRLQERSGAGRAEAARNTEAASPAA